MCCIQGSLKGESVVVAILSSRMEQSYCTSGFFRFQARFLTSSAPILTITHYLRTLYHPTHNLTHLPWQHQCPTTQTEWQRVQQQPRKLVAMAITTVVWRFTVTVHGVQIYHDFQCLRYDWRNTSWNILASFYWTDNSRYNDTGKLLVSGRILVFTRPIIFFYSHKLYIQNDDNMSHFFVFMI